MIHSETMPSSKPHIVLLGQTPPPWHGQAVATKILFEHDWPDFDASCLRMDYSEEMDEVGRFQFKKIARLARLVRNTREALSRSPESILFYPPASAKWIPFLRDAVFLACVRGKAAKTVFIFHASGLAAFSDAGPVRKWLASVAYQNADMALEVAEEAVAPHDVFAAKRHLWCPCGIEVPQVEPRSPEPGRPLEVLFIGSLQEGKGILEILKTAARLKASGHEKNFRFQIVGRWMDDRFASEAMAMHEALDLGRMVRFPGQLLDGAKWDAYRDADVFFFPSHYPSEASPIVLMEALGSGLPVVTTAWNGIPALMAGCPAATLLPVKSPEKYAEALVRLHASRGNLHEHASKARGFYEAHFTPARFVERVSDALRLVATPAPPGQAAARRSAPASERSGPLRLSVYLADQNPGHDRSLGITRMSGVVLNALAGREDVSLHTVASRTSWQGPVNGAISEILPWNTRAKIMRVMTDHLHPVLSNAGSQADVCYFPKGFLPKLRLKCPSVVTIHDTIIQYYRDMHPGWRKRAEYAYWVEMLKSSLTRADGILTVSENSKSQIMDFMRRYGLPPREILVTYEPCVYETTEQPTAPEKKGYVVHFSSKEPHKMTAPLVRWWTSHPKGRLPPLHLVGGMDDEVAPLIQGRNDIVKHSYLSDEKLQEILMAADALVIPSEIEGFGLPAVEAYYLGTPVCYNLGTSIEEILGESTRTGGFHLHEMDSLLPALEKTISMPADEVRRIGLELRARFATEKVVECMMRGFRNAART